MKNHLFTLGLMIPLLLGCGLADRVMKQAEPEANKPKVDVNANKSLTDQAVDTAIGDEKIGIAECDQAMDILSAQANNPDDNFVTKAVKKTALNTFREQLKKSLEDNKTDKKEVAKFCRDFRDGLEESANENSNGK